MQAADSDTHATMNTATLITLARVAMLPLIVWAFLAQAYKMVLLLFIVASLTDYVDGWVARRYNQQTRFGAMLDQVSDKLLVVTMLILIASTTWLGPWGVAAAVMIALREIWVSGLREYLGSVSVPVPVSKLAKYKTALQMAAIAVLVLAGTLPFHMAGLIYGAGQILLIASSLLGLWTGYQYTRAAWGYLVEEQRQN